MKLKSLLFGSAAAMVTVTGAQAADLPIAEPVEYVRICDAYGTGFFYIPGTETCLRISGEASFAAAYLSDGHGLYELDDGEFDGEDVDFVNNFGTEAGFELTFDARTQTGIGILRAYINIDGSRSTLPPYFVGEGGDSVDSGVGLDKAYIQILNDFGTLTMGQTDSFFLMEDSFKTKNFFDLINDPSADVNLFAYSFAFGNGFSATISLEDYEAGRARNDDFFFGKKGGFAGERDYPDLVAALRVDQGWGSAQLSGAVGQLNSVFEDVDSSLGWAVAAGVSVEVPNTMFSVALEGAYADGLVSYVDNTGFGFGDFFIGKDGDIEGNSGWFVSTGIEAGVTDTVALVLGATYTALDFAPDDTSFEAELTQWGLNFDVVWTPVDTFEVKAAVEYGHAEYDFDEDFLEGDDDDFDGSTWGVGVEAVKTF